MRRKRKGNGSGNALPGVVRVKESKGYKWKRDRGVAVVGTNADGSRAMA